jgi:hypothetical protein
LSHWVSGIVLLSTIVGQHWWPFRLLVYVFAATRLANLGNDLTYEWNRTAKFDPEDPETLTEEDL